MEYAVIVSLLAITILVAVVFLGSRLFGVFASTGDQVGGAGQQVAQQAPQQPAQQGQQPAQQQDAGDDGDNENALYVNEVTLGNGQRGCPEGSVASTRSNGKCVRTG